MRHAQHLRALAEFCDAFADCNRSGSTNARVDLVEYDDRVRIGLRERHLQREEQAGQLATRSRSSDRSLRLLWVKGSRELNAVGAKRSRLSRLQDAGERCAAQRQPLQF